MPETDVTSNGRVLIIAGSDSGGGAGIQADIKTVTALGGYAMTAITAITVQNTLGVFGIHEAPPEIVREQVRVVLEDIGADAIKTGMLANREMVETVAAALDEFAPYIPAIIDPVMVAKGGASLLADDAVDAVKSLLLPRAAVLTPNAPEATRLTGLDIDDVDGQKRAAQELLKLGARAVLLKGGHVPGAWVHDVLATPAGMEVFSSQRIQTNATHGTGCTLASAIAAGIAQGMDLPAALDWARIYLLNAIANAPGLGAGHGPLGHAWTLKGEN
jgi:hydroxymethylpyrimidine/phosphomethylpyrimidine kinase